MVLGVGVLRQPNLFVHSVGGMTAVREVGANPPELSRQEAIDNWNKRIN